jgi:hypothetical protein
MRQALSILTAATLLAACASTSSSSPRAESADSASCAELAKAASAGVHRAVDAHRACTADTECITVNVGASCFDHCSTVMSESGRADLDAARDQAATQCDAFLARGCKLIAPPCMAPAAPRCQAGSCV